MLPYVASQEGVSAVREEASVIVTSKGLGVPRCEGGRQLPATVFVLFDPNCLHMVDVDPRAVTKPLPLGHGVRA